MEKAEIEKLKQQGFILQKDKIYFTVRIKLMGKSISTEKMRIICEISERYGRGTVALGSGQRIEIPWVRLGYLEEMKKALLQAGLMSIEGSMAVVA